MKAYQVKATLDEITKEFFFIKKDMAENFVHNHSKVVKSLVDKEIQYEFNIIKVFEDEEEFTDEILDGINILFPPK
ncbi:MAG: hypothetical protein HN691_14205 [Bacteroidetes bacterium]|jgi:hypothetical protein|nr:hypothetical protein [Bacteroidota bacterium]